MSRTSPSLVLSLLALVLALGGVAPAAASRPVEDYAAYRPATRCADHAKPGAVIVGHWLVRHYGGGFGPILRECGGSRSEHTEGRAFDWTLDASTRHGRRSAKRFLHDAFATDAHGHRNAKARRMGIMYVIWDDHMYAAYEHFHRKAYLSSGCRDRKHCSATLRHRDHLHISFSRAGGGARTSWFDSRRG